MQKLVELARSHPYVLLTLCLPPEKGMTVVSPMNVFVLIQLGGSDTFGNLDEPSTVAMSGELAAAAEPTNEDWASLQSCILHLGDLAAMGSISIRSTTIRFA
jgi:hypothetical protein